MTLLSRMRRLRKLTVSTASGSDADVIDHDVIDIDDAREAVGEFTDHDSLEPCDKSPTRQCQYPDNATRCVHCGNPSRID